MLSKLHQKRVGFTLVEVMLVVAIIALLAAIALPNFFRARKRAQAMLILDDLRLLNDAVDRYAIDNSKGPGDAFTWTDLQPYFKNGTNLYGQMTPTPGNPGGNPLDTLGNTFRDCTALIDEPAADCANVCLNPKSFAALSDVAPSDFWSPYGVAPTP